MAEVEVKEVERICVNIEQAAELIGVSRTTMRTLAHRADFPALKLTGRILISVNGLREWVDKHIAEGGTLQ